MLKNKFDRFHNTFITGKNDKIKKENVKEIKRKK